MRRTTLGLLLLCLCGCSTFDYFSRKVVARAGDQVLTSDWFAETMAAGQVVLQPEILERWAWTWVQYSLFLQALADGETFLDSATVEEAMWPEMLIARVAGLHPEFGEAGLQLDSAQIDSVFSAGDYRVIDHILIDLDRRDPRSEIVAKRNRAEDIRARLLAGSEWANEVQASTDEGSRSMGGRIGTITLGDTDPEFESAAFALNPGEISEVIRTQHGFHIIRRPPLTEVRALFYRAMSFALLDRWKDGFFRELQERRNIRVEDDGPEIMREAAARPFRVLALEPGEVIGRYDGGKLTDVDFVMWLQAWPSENHLAVEDASDRELQDMAMQAMQNDALHLEALEAGVEIPNDKYQKILESLDTRLTRLRKALRADTAMARAGGLRERHRVAEQVLEEYYVRTASNLRDMFIVPPFLGAYLRSKRSWSFSYGGLNRAIHRAVELRAVSDSLTR